MLKNVKYNLHDLSFIKKESSFKLSKPLESLMAQQTYHLPPTNRYQDMRLKKTCFPTKPTTLNFFRE